ncbi:Crp/Fnr family transcriptional regulator [Candidatus Methanomassiliicoccus intestinalis]|uniref:Crp/Fnr family transcriptional regulator n=1 Tax=Candidatus Methanomassiliicoccus intestinalis TaxID=1406512 RepID=UPI0037DD6414
MKQYLSILSKTSLFAGLSEEELLSVLDCLQGRVAKYAKDAMILRTGDLVYELGIVLSGKVHIVQKDFWNNVNLLTELQAGQLFAEAYACLATTRLGVSAVALERTAVLWINVQRMMTMCDSACEFHTRLIRNLLWDLAEKNLLLTSRIEHTSKRSIREKLLSYLSEQARKAHSPEFIIPFNRQQLADYLSVDRSALSNELSKLRKEGIIAFEKNKFKLNDLS